MDAENTWQVNDWLWTSGQLSERDISRLPSLNIAAVINLALPTSANALRGEAELITGHGMDYFHIPVVWEAPQLAQTRYLLQYSRRVKGQESMGALREEHARFCVYLFVSQATPAGTRRNGDISDAGNLGSKRNVAEIYK